MGAACTKSPLSLSSPDTEASVLAPWALVRSTDQGQCGTGMGKLLRNQDLTEF